MPITITAGPLTSSASLVSRSIRSFFSLAALASSDSTGAPVELVASVSAVALLRPVAPPVEPLVLVALLASPFLAGDELLAGDEAFVFFFFFLPGERAFATGDCTNAKANGQHENAEKSHAMQTKRVTQEHCVITSHKLERTKEVGSSRVDLQACKLEYSIVSPK